MNWEQESYVIKAGYGGSLPILVFTLGGAVTFIGAFYLWMGLEASEVLTLGVIIFAVGAALLAWGAFISQWVAVFYIQGGHFGFVVRSMFGSRRAQWDYELSDFLEVDRSQAAPVVRLSGGRGIELPRPLVPWLNQIDGILCSLGGNLPGYDLLDAGAGTLVKEWPCHFSNEYPNPAEQVPAPPALIDSNESLQSLIARYHKSIIFREALPAAWSLAKMFTEFKRTNGGLALFGVRPDATMVGLPEDEVDRAAERMKRLAGELTEARVEIGRIELDDKIALFAVFNVIPSHTKPLEPYESTISDVAVV